MWIGEVAQPVPLHRCYDYEIPETLLAAARPGCRVRTCFGPTRRLVQRVLGGVSTRLFPGRHSSVSGRPRWQRYDAIA